MKFKTTVPKVIPKKLPIDIPKKTVDDILNKSYRATCGITERAVNVSAKELYPTAAKLERAGYNVIGTSFGKTPIKKIWFIRRGGL